MTQLLNQLSFIYKESKLIPDKANTDQQKDFIERYQNLDFALFKQASNVFLQPARDIESLRSLLTDNFKIINYA